MAQGGNFLTEPVVDLSRLFADFCSFKGNSLTNRSRIKGEGKRRNGTVFKTTIRNDPINNIHGIDFTWNPIRTEVVENQKHVISNYTPSFNPIIITPGQEERLTLPNIRFSKSTDT